MTSGPDVLWSMVVLDRKVVVLWLAAVALGWTEGGRGVVGGGEEEAVEVRAVTEGVGGARGFVVSVGEDVVDEDVWLLCVFCAVTPQHTSSPANIINHSVRMNICLFVLITPNHRILLLSHPNIP